MVAPEREWELLRVVERAARQYRQAQQALADREAQGGEEAAFRAALGTVTQAHHQLDAALLAIQRYYESAGVAVE
jgi:hypothetical protein